jgi:hypothetical protein
LNHRPCVPETEDKLIIVERFEPSIPAYFLEPAPAVTGEIHSKYSNAVASFPIAGCGWDGSTSLRPLADDLMVASGQRLSLFLFMFLR